MLKCCLQSTHSVSSGYWFSLYVCISLLLQIIFVAGKIAASNPSRKRFTFKIHALFPKDSESSCLVRCSPPRWVVFASRIEWSPWSDPGTRCLILYSGSHERQGHNWQLHQNQMIWRRENGAGRLGRQSNNCLVQILLLFSHQVMCDSLWPHGLQHTRLSCPSPSPRACWNSCPLSRWCHPTICRPLLLPSIFLASGSFPWVSSSHQVAKILEFQLQHQFFQWVFKTDLL